MNALHIYIIVNPTTAYLGSGVVVLGRGTPPPL